MALTGNGTRGWKAVGVGNAAASAPAYSMLCWIKASAAAADFVPLSWAGSSGWSQFNFVTASTQWWFYDNDDVNTAAVCVVADVIPTTWRPLVLTKRSQTGRLLYVSTIDNTGTDATALSTQTLTDVYVGEDTNASHFLPTTAQVAECAIWMAELGTFEVSQLLSGANPLTVKPDKLVCYFPLRYNLRDYGPRGMSLLCLTAAAPVFSDHPPVQDMPEYDYLGPFSFGYLPPVHMRSRAFLTR
jgi:hypothetical protein